MALYRRGQKELLDWISPKGQEPLDCLQTQRDAYLEELYSGSGPPDHSHQQDAVQRNTNYQHAMEPRHQHYDSCNR
jgi:hypothetical protein